MSKVNVRHLSVLVLLCFIMALVPPIPVFADEVTQLNVRDYGAVGDGQTDDRAAIQAAIDAAATGSGGGVVQFPAGTYLVEEIVVLKSNITLTLDQNATILNGINQASHPSIIFMTGPFTEDGEQVLWGSTQNITITGGTIDMNGELNTSGSAAKNLPNIGSSGAFALGYSSNVTIENVTFRDSYKGHAIQICACNGVTIKNCSFLGQALPNFLTDSQKINLETIQIEPSTTKGFPYALNATGAPSQNITIEDCYFGASTKTGEPVVAIGTHNQVVSAQKCHHINILDNEFDNMMYAGIRFCGYEDVTIQSNVFTKKTAAQSVHYRENGCFLINAYCYNNTTDSLDLNRRITINNNTFNIADPNTRGIRVAKDKDTYLGTVTDIAVTNNTITNTSSNSDDIAIQTMRISNNLTITGNTISGGYRGIEAQYCSGNITINNNNISNMDYQHVRLMSCGSNQKIYFYTHGNGSLNVSTSNNVYTFTAVPNPGCSFVAYYKENALSTLVSTNSTLTFPVNQSSNVYRHPLFE